MASFRASAGFMHIAMPTSAVSRLTARAHSSRENKYNSKHIMQHKHTSDHVMSHPMGCNL